MVLLLLALVGAYLGVCWVLSGKYLSPSRNYAYLQPWLRKQEVAGEPCFVTESIASHKPQKLVFVLAHGMGGNRSQFQEVAETLEKHGYGVILPAMVGQDESKAEHIGFGVDESEELAKICDAAREMPGHPKVIVGGVSMGGAAAWLTTERTKVDGVITESAFADFRSSAYAYLDKALPMGHIAFYPVIAFGQMRSGLDIDSILPERAAKAYKGASVVIHSGDDRTIPISHGERLAKAAGVELQVMEGAHHAMARDVDPDRYDSYFLRLAKRVIGPTDHKGTLEQ